MPSPALIIVLASGGWLAQAVSSAIRPMAISVFGNAVTHVNEDDWRLSPRDGVRASAVRGRGLLIARFLRMFRLFATATSVRLEAHLSRP